LTATVAEVFQLELDDLELFIDRRQMYQVFFNLILNAIQAVPPQDGIIKLRAEKQEHYVDLVVEDNGRGIEKSDFGKIFTPFYTTKDKGTGLGLAISRRMIDDHEGKILFDSVAGEGTSFRIRLFKYRTRKSNDSQSLSA
jgi:signal transduction histidine kinase